MTNQQAQLSLKLSEPLADLTNNKRTSTLVACAATLIGVMTQLKRAHLTGNIQILRQYLLEAIVDFEVKANQQQLAKSTINSARYILCATLDEIILSQQLNEQAPWNSQNDWSKQSLVSTFYQDNWGGENFFEILEQAQRIVEQNIELLELIFLCLQLGFQGKYQIMEQGQQRLILLREKLYIVIYQYRGKPAAFLASYVKTGLDTRQTVNPFVLIFLTAGILIGALFELYLFFNKQLNIASQQVYQALSGFGLGV